MDIEGSDRNVRRGVLPDRARRGAGRRRARARRRARGDGPVAGRRRADALRACPVGGRHRPRARVRKPAGGRRFLQLPAPGCAGDPRRLRRIDGRWRDLQACGERRGFGARPGPRRRHDRADRVPRDALDPRPPRPVRRRRAIWRRSADPGCPRRAGWTGCWPADGPPQRPRVGGTARAGGDDRGSLETFSTRLRGRFGPGPTQPDRPGRTCRLPRPSSGPLRVSKEPAEIAGRSMPWGRSRPSAGASRTKAGLGSCSGSPRPGRRSHLSALLPLGQGTWRRSVRRRRISPSPPPRRTRPPRARRA